MAYKTITQPDAIQEAARSPRFWATLSPLLLAVSFLFALVFQGGLLPGMNAEALGSVMQVELVVLIAGAFMVIPVTAPVRPDNRVGKTLQWIVFTAFFVHFARMAWTAYGPWGTLSFAVLTWATYGGALLRRGPPERGATRWIVAALRWVVAIAAFVIAISIADLPASSSWWTSEPNILPAGVVYFGILASVEASGVFIWLEDNLFDLGMRSKTSA